MASSVPLVPNYVYDVIRLKMAESVNSLLGTKFFVITGKLGGLVQQGETLTAATIQHCRHHVNFRLDHNDRLYIEKVVNGFMDHELVKITIIITDVLCGKLQWRARHHTPALVVAVIDSINEDVVA